mmetsp:Transcript_13587/g.26210  ORF Transcript_13587/g.26210 Transcript_13587/m.26210 type:complete len:223 (+) Transcript_13587:2612-3280(+)
MRAVLARRVIALATTEMVQEASAARRRSSQPICASAVLKSGESLCGRATALESAALDWSASSLAHLSVALRVSGDAPEDEPRATRASTRAHTSDSGPQRMSCVARADTAARRRESGVARTSFCSRTANTSAEEPASRTALRKVRAARSASGPACGVRERSTTKQTSAATRPDPDILALLEFMPLHRLEFEFEFIPIPMPEAEQLEPTPLDERPEADPLPLCE